MVNTVVSKIRVRNPNKKSAKYANASECRYIATRSGVWIDNKTNYSFDEENQNLSMSDDKTYVSYICMRPNSHGLFGNIDVEHLSTVCNKIKHKTEEGNLIYRGIVSLIEEDAINLGYYNQNKWKNLLNATMSSIGSEFNIPIQNLEWVAAYHFQEGHPHVHYMLWNKEQHIASPYIHPSKQQRCREIFSKEIFKDERSLYIQEKTATRDLILEFGKDIMSESETLVQDLIQLELKREKIPGKIYSSEINTLSKELIGLANSLPEKGKISYAYMPKEIKEQICAITDTFFNRVDMRKELVNYLAATENISKSYSTLQLKQYIQKSNAYKDLQKRLGNIILKSASSVKKYQEENRLPPKLMDSLFTSNVETEAINKLEPININDNFNEFISNSLNNFANSFDDELQPISSKQQDQSSSSIGITKDSNTNYWTKEYKKAKTNLYGNKVVKPDIALAISLLKQETEKENPLAMYDLGTFYETGNLDGIDINQEKAKSYYLSAFKIIKNVSETENNNYYMHYRLGKMYQYGIGTETDLNKAFDLYTSAAEAGNSSAQYSLAKMYLDGKAVEQNFEQALKYFLSSVNNAKRINPFSCYELGKMYCNKDNEFYNLEKGISYLDASAKQSNSYAQFFLGKLYANKENNFYNIHTAVSYLKDAAKQGSILSQVELYKIYLDKDLPYFDPKSIEDLKKLAESGNDIAQCALGCTYLFNKDFKEKKALAIYWLKKAEKQGNTYATRILQQDREMTKAFMYQQSFKTILNIFDSMVSYNHETEYEQNTQPISKEAVKDYLKKKGINLERDNF